MNLSWLFPSRQFWSHKSPAEMTCICFTDGWNEKLRLTLHSLKHLTRRWRSMWTMIHLGNHSIIQLTKPDQHLFCIMMTNMFKDMQWVPWSRIMWMWWMGEDAVNIATILMPVDHFDLNRTCTLACEWPHHSWAPLQWEWRPSVPANGLDSRK